MSDREQREWIDPHVELRLALYHLCGWAQGLTDDERSKWRGVLFEFDQAALKMTATLVPSTALPVVRTAEQEQEHERQGAS